MITVLVSYHSVAAPLAQNQCPWARGAPLGREFALAGHGFERGPQEDPDRRDDLLETRRRLGQLPVPYERGPLAELRGIACDIRSRRGSAPPAHRERQKMAAETVRPSAAVAEIRATAKSAPVDYNPTPCLL